MVIYVFRFIIVYFVMIFSMRFLGKRQLGQMEMSELIAAFFLSELATDMLTDKNVSFIQGILSICIMIVLELSVSFLAIKFPLMKKIFDFSPDFLIKEGKILEKELLKNRVTLDELFSMLRQSGFYDINTVRFAILEPNGQLSVVPFAQFDTPTLNDLSIQTEDLGYSVAVIDDGKINEKALSLIGKNQNWLKDELRKLKVKNVSDVFVLSANFKGEIKFFPKENR